ncbi:hypothetical protein [Candidatus Poriferisocius sp.]|uniref:hypothetical protein n=1 Tax=Candidatus Poriferisocius sp. TaxID=3101276 RepID=UPI003B0193A7
MSYELFSLASDLRQQAVACERVRGDVDRIWYGLDNLLDGPVARHVPLLWKSAAADASRLRLHNRRTHLARLRYEIENTANRLQARADELHADAARVEHAAEAARREEARELALQATYFQ